MAAHIAGAATGGEGEAPPYPAPFPGTVFSVYGPRNFAPSLFHNGIDYRAPRDTAIPAPADGFVSDILVDEDKAGIRLYLTIKPKIEIGFGHLFRSRKAGEKEISSGGFILLIGRKFTIPPGPGRPKVQVRSCNAILHTATRIALVPPYCKDAAGSTLLHGKTPTAYTVSNQVTKNQVLAPVGDSGSAGATGPHLHLIFGRGQDSSMHVIDHPDGAFCARLADAGASPSACETPSSTPTLTRDTLQSRHYIDVRVDHTGRLDLDEITFTLSSSPPQTFNIQYGGSPSKGKSIQGKALDLPAFRSFVRETCDTATVPAQNGVLICPLDFKGQDVEGAKLETVFRLGVDPTGLPDGANYVDVELRNTNDLFAQGRLPFNVTSNANIPTVTIGVSPTNVTVGSTASLTWSSQAATSCAATGSWSGAQGTSGTIQVSPTTAGTYTFGLNCTGPGGSAAASTTLTAVNPAPPTGSIKITSITCTVDVNSGPFRIGTLDVSGTATLPANVAGGLPGILRNPPGGGFLPLSSCGSWTRTSNGTCSKNVGDSETTTWRSTNNQLFSIGVTTGVAAHLSSSIFPALFIIDAKTVTCPGSYTFP